jgi:hypothetical protein
MTPMLNHPGAPVPVLAAYRTDLAQRPGASRLAPHDEAWLAIGSLLTHSGWLTRERRVPLFTEVRRLLRETLGEDAWGRGAPLDPRPPRDELVLSPRVRALCEEIEDAGAVNLAGAILGAYLGSRDHIDGVELGRIDALRGRFAWKAGAHDIAEDHYRKVEARARRVRSAELLVRSYIGYAVIARLKGNFPASRIAARRAVSLAEPNGFTRLAALGHQSLMIAAVVAGDMNTALHHGWHAYRGVQGDPTAEAVKLVDVAQLFLDAGHVEFATAGFAAALQRHMSERVLMPALGGAAMAAARRGDADAVARMADAVRAHADQSSLPYANTACELDIAEAYIQLGRRGDAEPFRRSALAVATAHRYHELIHRAETLSSVQPRTAPAPVPLTQESHEIGEAVRQLAGAVD